MHDDRTAGQAPTPPAPATPPAPPPQRCWNCGTTPNIRCCEFGRDR